MADRREGPGGAAGDGGRGRPDARRAGLRVEVDGLVVPLPDGCWRDGGGPAVVDADGTLALRAPGLDADGLIALVRGWAEGAGVVLEDRLELPGALSLVFRRLDGGGVSLTLRPPSGDRAEPLLLLAFRRAGRRERDGRGAW